MNLQAHLLLRICSVTVICLLITASYLIYHNQNLARQTSQTNLDTLVKQLQFQILRGNSGIGLNYPFPDFDLWKQTRDSSGFCVDFVPADGGPGHNICNGSKFTVPSWPTGFERLYRALFHPDIILNHALVFNGRNYGNLSVTASSEMEIAHAWEQLTGLFELALISSGAICIWTFVEISRALSPAKLIVAGLEDMERGNLAYRLPLFQLNEWRRISTAINRLAASQQKLLEERRQLTARLLTLQDEERRYIAGELHDEFGQCLAAINALGASIGYSSQHQPEIRKDAEQISVISQRMMKNIKALLQQLRPSELDELGLAASLNSLVNEWNAQHANQTRYVLSITGDCRQLPENLPTAIFRVIQEAMTNIAKHAKAAQADIALEINRDLLSLTIRDNGAAKTLPLAENRGMGLSGMRERIFALHGGITLAIAKPHGLIIRISIPLTENSAA